MTGSVALDVAIGLIFVYLLYSLLASVICEIIANYLGLRARNLREALIRLLEDGDDEPRAKFIAFLQHTIFSIKDLFSRPGGEVVKKFYKEPTIRHLAKNDFYSSPSYISPANFSKALLEILRKEGTRPENETDLQCIREVLENQTWIPLETRQHIKSLLRDARNDLTKFRILLERWYDDTMERAIGWYKQKIQVVLLLVGLSIAIIFNASTIRIVHVLSKDDKSREEMVKLATAYVAREPAKADTTASNQAALDSLLAVKERLQEDIALAHNVMGMGWNVPDSATLVLTTMADSLRKIKQSFLTVRIAKNEDRLLLVPAGFAPESIGKLLCYGGEGMFLTGVNQTLTRADLLWWPYFFETLRKNFWGYLLTAIAISLGSPFWFDLLSRLVQIRSSVRQPVRTVPTTEGSLGTTVDPVLRKG